MKRILAIILALSLLMIPLALTGCDQSNEEPVETPDPATTQEPTSEPEPEGVSLSIVSTIFPQYDWVRQILGDRADYMELTLLINNRIDFHSFQPSPSDIIRAATADVFIYVGGHSDNWVADALAQAVNPDMVVINLMEVLGDRVVYEEVVEGMQHGCATCESHSHHGCDCDDCATCESHSHHDCDCDECDTCSSHSHHDCDDGDCDTCADHDHAHGHSHDHDDCDDDECDTCASHDHDDCDHHHDHDHDDCDHHHHDELDEHVWLSLRNAAIITSAIAEVLAALDPDFAETYRANMEAYNEKLIALDAEFQAVVDAAAITTLLFADRFPFRYFVDDYNLSYYAAFTGCSAAIEVTSSTIVFLVGKVDELELHSVMVIEDSDKSIAEAVIRETASGDQQILVLDSMQTANDEDWQNGITYLSIMESNLEVLRQALS